MTRLPTCLAAVVFSIAATTTTEKLRNFSQTLKWKGTVIHCESIDEVVNVIEMAQQEVPARRVKGLGSGWSWSTALASDGDDIYVQLDGPLADASKSVLEDSNPAAASVVVPGGVLAFDLYMLLQTTEYNIEAKGQCLSANRGSQTMGGLLATNVHHTGTRTFYDVVEWVEVVTARDGLVRTIPGEDLFRLTIGGGGRTGIIVRVKFRLAVRATYRTVETSQPADDSWQTFFRDYVELTSGYEPNEFIGLGVRVPGLVGGLVAPFSGKLRMDEPSSNPAVLPSNFGDLNFFAKALLLLDSVFDLLMPSIFYDAWLALLSSVFVATTGVDSKGTTGEDLDVAVSGAFNIEPHHQEVEFFIPVDQAETVGEYIDGRFADGAYGYIKRHSLVALRFVYGTDSLTAANGVLADGSAPDVIAVNLDGYQKREWPRFTKEVNELLADLATAFPQRIRTHPGKFNPPMSPDPETPAVKDLIADMDPQGIFARDAYDPAFLTRPPKTGPWWWPF